jgi:hypothetical protein
MKHFYSPSLRGFLIEGVHRDIPEDAIEITAAEHQLLQRGQAEGKVIGIGAGGRPALQDGWAADAEELAKFARRRRDNLLKASDARMLPDYPIPEAERAAWVEYRKALRAVPQQAGFPHEISWPVMAAPSED